MKPAINEHSSTYAMRQAFAERFRELVELLAQTAEYETVTRVLAMADPFAGLSMALERARLTEAALRHPLAAARVRGLGAREELVERAGGVLRLAEVARRLGVTSQAVTARRGRGTLLAVPMPNGEWVYPARQFGEAGVITGLGGVVREFREVSPWTQLAVLLAPSARFGGSSAFDLLEAGDIEGARSIAATYGEQG